MIEVSFISLCQNEAHKRYSQILDRFAIRRGEKTWFTRTTYNILDKFINMLKEKTDYETSIAVYVHNKKATKLYTVIGENLFNPIDNAIPVAYSKNLHYHLKEKNKIFDLIEPVLYLSALLHDIGKNNVSFQNKIRQRHSNIRDIIRHDFASLIILSNSSLLEMFLNNNLKNINLNQEEYINNTIDYIYTLFEKDKFTLKDAVNFTILTHHKNFIFSKKKRYLKREILKEFTDNTKDECLIFNDFDFTYIEKVEELTDVYKNDLIIEINRNDFINICLLTRTLLMFADHYASGKKLTNKITDNMILANKQQRLESHLLEVFKDSKNVYNELLVYKKTKKTDFNLKKSKIDRFIWQDKAAEFVKNNTDNNKDVLFVINNAETGSGKTIGNVKILNAFTNNKNRFNFLFPMRNLSVQTFDVLAKELNINKDDLALIIGQDENKTERDDNKENIEDMIEYVYTQALQKQYDRNKNYKNLFEKPVVIGTFDYLMKATENKKSKYLLPFARLFTSDLIIDEIDNFSLNDLQAITRFFFITGILGKNIILSSATLTYPIIKTMLESYKRGFEIFNKSNDKKLKIIGINNITSPCFLNNEDEIRTFLENKNKIIEKSESKVHFDIKKEFNAEEILKKIYRFHNNFYQSVKNKRISTGFIKFYHVSDLFRNYLDFLKYLEENKKDNYKVVTLFFHSKDFEGIKQKKEELLYSILQKKDKKYLENFYNLIKDYQEENIIFLLFTTPILEVGKDLDFDFGISEYTSLVDIIQTAGRVRRHRNQQVRKDNFIIFFNKRNNFKFLEIDKEKTYELLNDIKNKKIDSSLLFNNEIATLELSMIEKKLNESLEYTNEINCVLSCNHLKEFIFRKSLTKSETYIVKEDKKFYLYKGKGAGFNVTNLEKQIDFDFDKYLIKTFEIENNDLIHINFYNNEDLNDFMYSKNFGFLKKNLL